MKKAKFNIIDVLIVVVILGLIVGMAIRYDLAGQVGLSQNSDTVEATFIVENIQERSQEYIKEGTKFFYMQQSTDFGTIKEILDIREAARSVELVNGELVKSYIPGRIDVTGVITCVGKNTKEGFMLNGNSFISAGKEFLIHSGNLEITITILGINVLPSK